MMLKHSLMPGAALVAAFCATAAAAQPVADAVPAPIIAPAAIVVAPATTKTADAAADDRQNEMICRKTPETGSLVKVKKTCHTRSQWAYIEQENKRMGQQFILDNQGRPPGGN